MYGVQTARLMWHLALARRAALREQPRDLGASALEWAIISAIVVAAAVLIGGVIYNLIQDKGDALEECANTGFGSEGC